MLITWLIATAMLTVVVSIQLVLNGVLACPSVPGKKKKKKKKKEKKKKRKRQEDEKDRKSSPC